MSIRQIPDEDFSDPIDRLRRTAERHKAEGHRRLKNGDDLGAARLMRHGYSLDRLADRMERNVQRRYREGR